MKNILLVLLPLTLFFGCLTVNKHYSKKELQELLNNKSPEEVIELIGRPSDVKEDVDSLWDNNGKFIIDIYNPEFFNSGYPEYKKHKIDQWDFNFYPNKILYEPISQTYKTFQVYFLNNKVYSVID